MLVMAACPERPKDRARPKANPAFANEPTGGAVPRTGMQREGEVLKRAFHAIATGVALLALTVAPGAARSAPPTQAARDALPGNVVLIGEVDLDGRRGDESASLELPGDGGRMILRVRRGRDGDVLWAARFGQVPGYRHSPFGSSVRGHLAALADVDGDTRADVVVVHATREAEVPEANLRLVTLGISVLDGRNGKTKWSADLGAVSASFSESCDPGVQRTGVVSSDLYAGRDLDLDGIADVVASLVVGQLTCPEVFVAAGYSGSNRGVAWGFSGPGGEELFRIAAIDGGSIRPAGDLTGDGVPDLVESGPRLIAGRSTAGTVLWVRPWIHHNTPRVVRAFPLQLDRDRSRELLVSTGFDPDHPERLQSAVALDGVDGALLWESRVTPQEGGKQWLVGDANGDGIDDLLRFNCADGDCVRSDLELLSGENGSPLWRNRARVTATRYVICCADVDGDGIADPVVQDCCVEAGERFSDTVAAFSGSTGRRLWDAWATHRVREFDPLRLLYPVGGDVDGDGRDDLLSAVPVSEDTIEVAIHRGIDGTRIWRVRLPAPSVGWGGETTVLRAPRALLVALGPGGEQAVTRCRLLALRDGRVLWRDRRC